MIGIVRTNNITVKMEVTYNQQKQNKKPHNKSS